MIPRRALFGALLTGPACAVAQSASPSPRRLLEEARAFLCARCSNDVEAEGVNRPMRRAMLAEGTLRQARAAVGDRPRVTAPIDRALAALESLDEAAAIRAINKALAAMRG